MAQTATGMGKAPPGAVTYLRTWKSHVALRNSMARYRPTETLVLSAILPDMKVQTELSVYSGENRDTDPRF